MSLRNIPYYFCIEAHFAHRRLSIACKSLLTKARPTCRQASHDISRSFFVPSQLTVPVSKYIRTDRLNAFSCLNQIEFLLLLLSSLFSILAVSVI